MLEDPSLTKAIQKADTQSNGTEAFKQIINRIIKGLQGKKFETRIADYRDIEKRVLGYMGMKTSLALPETPFILLADDLLPSDIPQIAASPARGVVLKETSPVSHSAILLRSFGIPSIIADIMADETDKSILDADLGLLITDPQPDEIEVAEQRQYKNEALSRSAYQKRLEPAVASSGKRVSILANITDLKSALEAKEQGAEGIGLLRTEFLFKDRAPTVDEQTRAYREIFDLFDSPTIRTLDVGGDKELPYIGIPNEKNPFLGIRGIRLFKSHPQIIKEQLEAIFRAAEGRAVKIMFPMVSEPQEFIDAKAFVLDIAAKHTPDTDNIQFGIMVEVPSVIFQMEAFNQIVDFYSIGTNDLTQYLFAIERTHPSLTTDPLSPVLFRAIEEVYQKSAKPVSICGELAGMEEALPRLMEIGFTILSMAPSHIPLIKERVRNA
ncbi:MAG TPA: phosphoenolpyruvate--protein phosphotransferase, partial [Desulfobacterales bacterium]|nr:phosphoenolpyruvate--protein phosphotransferase [Desulfobacterales bacterium]